MTRPDVDQRLSALLKSIAPEPPSALTFDPSRADLVPQGTPRSRRRLAPTSWRGLSWALPALVTAAVAVVVTAVFIGVGPHVGGNEQRGTVAGSGSPAAASRCAELEPHAQPVRLRLPRSTMAGDRAPVPVRVAAGSTIRVVAEFGTRVMTFPAATSPGLQLLCRVRDGFSAESYFRVAATSGSVEVTSHTADCPGCARMALTTTVVIADPRSGGTQPGAPGHIAPG